MRKWLLMICAVMLIFDAAMAIYPTEIVLLWINAQAGCYPWSPKEVEFKQGMTLCPGQNAKMTIEIPINRADEPRI